MMVTYTDDEGSVWEIEEKNRFSEDWNPDIIDEVFWASPGEGAQGRGVRRGVDESPG